MNKSTFISFYLVATYIENAQVYKQTSKIARVDASLYSEMHSFDFDDSVLHNMTFDAKVYETLYNSDDAKCSEFLVAFDDDARIIAISEAYNPIRDDDAREICSETIEKACNAVLTRYLQQQNEN